MKLLIVVPRYADSEDVNYNYLFPLGLAYISSVLKQAGHCVDCLNMNHYTGTVDSLILEFLAGRERCDFVCTGGISSSYRQIKLIAEAVRNAGTGTGLILGGGLISSEPELMFNTLHPDYIIIGEGERTMLELMECLERRGNIEDVNGIGYRDKDCKIILTNERQPIMELNSIPWPDYESFEFETYLNNMRPSDQFTYDLFDSPRVYPIICSRSCPFSCTFCYHPIGNRYRQRSMDDIMHELDVMVKRYRINMIAIYDELFSCGRDRVYEFCRRIKELFDEISWECRWFCQIRVDKLDEELLKTMKNAGCYLASYGFESYSTTVLRSMRKRITPEQIDRAVHLTLENNLSLHGNFIFGDAAETTETASETLDYWKQHNYAGILLNYINPYPGTHLYKLCLERGIIKDKLDFIANHIVDIMNMSLTMTDEEFEQLRISVFEANMRYRIFVVPHALRKIEGCTYDICVKCPHCGEIIEYKNYLILSKWLFIFLMYCRNCRRRFHLVSRLRKILYKLVRSLYTTIGYRFKVVIYNFVGDVKESN